MAETRIKIVSLSSLHRVFPDYCPENNEIKTFSALRNEPFSFQFAYKLESENYQKRPFYLRIESDLPMNAYSVGYVPVTHSEKIQDDLKRGPGLYPDMLIPKLINAPIDVEKDYWSSFWFERGEKNNLMAYDDCWQSLWLNINEDGKKIPAGKFSVNIKFYSRMGNTLFADETVEIEIIDSVLPKQKFYNTSWFHCDCLADIYNVEVFSDRFFEIFESFAQSAAKNGMNMIFLPAFTPPLDTPIGTERMTVQLVGVEYKNRKYSFDFSLMKRYIDICRRVGIEYFEHNHLFTQWGATSAPKIVATVNGKEKRIFGWDTDATDKKYIDFLHAYIAELAEFLKQEKLEKKILFHISDEPDIKNASGYINAKKELGGCLSKYMCGDAMSEYTFYENKMVDIPIVSIAKLEDFVGRCDDMWCYYTCSSRGKKRTNRLVINSSEVNRIFGVLMYYFKVKGFLHWGFNYYYDMLSHGLFNPSVRPDGYYGRPGASYLVYPELDGTAIQSVRQKVFYDAINDIRALQLLEKLYDRKTVENLIENCFGEITIDTLPESPEIMLSFRNKVNEMIKESI